MWQGQFLSLKNWGLTGRALLRVAVAPCLTLLLVIVFWDRFAEIDLQDTRDAIVQITLPQWIAALALSGASYWALGRFDTICHRMLRTKIPQRNAARSGAAALAVSQTLGLGILTGAIARWRLLPDLKPTQALAVSSFCALSFMGVWAVLALIAIGFSDLHILEASWIKQAAQGTVVAIFVAVLALALVPRGWPRKVRVQLRQRDIGLRSLAALALYATIDMLAAAGVLAVLLNQPIPPTTLVTVFFLALGAGLMSSTPSGLGAFELTMLSLLPQSDPALLMASITGYRLIYFTIPALLGLIALAHPPLITCRPRKHGVNWDPADGHKATSSKVAHILNQAPFAEAYLARQPGIGLLWSNALGGGGVIGEVGRSMAMLRDPFPHQRADEVLDGFLDYAKDHGRIPCLYKCNGRTAAALRRRGFFAMRVSHEAWLDPKSYDVSRPERRQLRRKLRQAEKAGIRFEYCQSNRLPLHDMARINEAWINAHGGERGFSMGRYIPALLDTQRVYLAWDGSHLVGFVSFHTVPTEWSLDLLRPMPDTKDGVAPGLIDLAIKDALSHGIPRVSLAAAPREQSSERDLGESPLDHLKRRLAHRSGGFGLARFKSMFAPNWQALYIVAPSKGSLVLAGLEIARAISAPLPHAQTDPKFE